MIIERLGDKNHKRTAFELCAELGLDPREFQDVVRQERLTGAPICAHNGYYIGDADDIEKNRITLARKANEIRRVWRAMGETAERLRKVKPKEKPADDLPKRTEPAELDK
jgi:hypothetical protein